eukprot:TRINITY_DN8096_c0_g1_i5.p1 TRINITY_DN8096_c0_g1~~TRINITY_DN8096_c0_g1_i5.p1  ORF type:complete len:371 (+),score=88.50 TRINITY_DN8096_c0_g1_i5:50-1162(+)
MFAKRIGASCFVSAVHSPARWVHQPAKSLSKGSGIVGLPNVGKSTLFNALAKSKIAHTANYPFCTIDPNVVKVAVPDERLDKLALLGGSSKTVPAYMEFIDIAGLVPGASKGEGMGNQFLSNIRDVSTILHLLRCFERSDVTHVIDDKINPIRDACTIEDELKLADMASLEKLIAALTKKASKSTEKAAQLKAATRAIKELEQGKMISDMQFTEEEWPALRELRLLTAKPIIYACNVDESSIDGNHYTKEFSLWLKKERKAPEPVIVCASTEEEISLLEDESLRKELLTDMGIKQSSLQKIVSNVYNLLRLKVFYTVGPKEARAWCVHEDSTASECAGEIHSDMEKGFLGAEFGFFSFVCFIINLGRLSP